MYIQIRNAQEAPALISRKLFKAFNFTGPGPWFIQLSRIKGTDAFAIVKRTNKDTFKTQCSIVTRTPGNNKRAPACFYWTIPSLEYFLAVTGMNLVTSKILKVKEFKTNNLHYFKICTD